MHSETFAISLLDQTELEFPADGLAFSRDVLSSNGHGKFCINVDADALLPAF